MKTKLTKLTTILILSIITMNCKKSTEPLTLSDRAGTYTFENKGWTIYHYVVVNKDGTGTYTGHNQQTFDTIIGNPSSTETSFTFTVNAQNFTIDFKNGTLTQPRPYGVWTLVR
ncbi:hypothetical protein [Brachyspira aalborgi]|uniref:Uncharacterized protein n=1 Tax=Brachyspira aalborgi TaxID=29522 RepID=A0A5C8CI46_9SPIR|nr:hypothetical protein [Brachyspira aalborgi]TXJ12001.1 hypothetical protein EPJ80_09910 [Brachyspira aalborgi]